MEERSNNLTGELLQEAIDNIDFHPNANYLLITVNQIKSESGLEIVSSNEMTLDEYQYVVASGPRSLYKPGDKVYLNMKKLLKKMPDPNDRMNYIEAVDIIPFVYEEYVLTFIDDNAVLGKLGADSVDIKA